MYFPENDLALAFGKAGYTPPPAARQLHMAGEALPLWMGCEGDRFVCSGLNAGWYLDTCRTFGIADVDVYDHHATALEASPWGWSAASRRALTDAGYPEEQMPDDAALANLRGLSHRRTASLLASKVASHLPFAIAGPAIEAQDIEAAAAYFDYREAVIAKAPWSCSGRGLVRSRHMPREQFLQQVAGIIRRQGSVMLEPEYEKVLDFALLFEADGRGNVDQRGLSVFTTNQHGGYTANLLESQQQLRSRIVQLCRAGEFEAVEMAVAEALPDLLGDYRGPLGIDMLVCADGTIDAAVELNLRYTMGFVALDFMRYVDPHSSGTLSVVPGPEKACSGAVVEDHKLTAGTLDLTPANPYFAFRACVSESL